MDYRLKATNEFRADFDDATNYIANTLHNPIAAEALLDELVKNVKSVTVFPKASKAYASPPEVDADYYALQVKNYLAFYVVRGDVIEFRRFLYARADLRDRLKT